MDGNLPVCYYLDSVRNFFDPNPKFKWVEMCPDRCVNKVKESHKAGIISFKISVHNVTDRGPIDYKNFDSWRKKVPKRSLPIKIRAYIYQCKDLPAADATGTSDPYIEVWDTSEKTKETDVCEDNNNPLFYEVLELDYEVMD
jgi:hypothetical protein